MSRPLPSRGGQVNRATKPGTSNRVAPPSAEERLPLGARSPEQVLQLQQAMGNRRTARHFGDQAPVQRYAPEYGAPRLARGPRPATGVAYDPVTFERPAFDEATINAVYHRAPQEEFQHPRNGTQIEYQCARCQRWFPYEAMDIGHRVPWETYLAWAQPADTAEARDAYNDLNNLHLECSTCNRGHAWEGGSDSDSDSDASDSDDSFIDDTEADSDADADAMQEVRQWAAAASQPGGVQPSNDAAAASSGPVNRNVTIRRRGPGGGGTGGAGAGGGTQLSQD